MSDFNFYPFESGDGAFITEPRWTDMFTWMRTVGVLSEDTTLAPDAELAVNPADPSIGTQVQVEDGQGFIQGFMFIQTNGPEVIDIPLNDSGDPRIDILVLRLDKTNDIISYVDIAGTPDPSPVPPDPVQNSTIWDLPLAQIYVADGATTITSGDITDLRVRSTQGDGGSSAVTLESVGSGQSIVAQGTGPNLEAKSIEGINNATVTSDADTVTVDVDFADITLTNAGVGASLVNTSSGPNVKTKGVIGGSGIVVANSSTDITLSAATNSVCILRNAVDVSVGNGTTVSLLWDTEELDPSGMHPPGQDYIYALSPGIYAVNAWIQTSSTASATDAIVCSLYHFDSNLSANFLIGESYSFPKSTNNFCDLSISTIVKASTNDYFYLLFVNLSGVSITIYSSQTYPLYYKFPRFSVIKISD